MTRANSVKHPSLSTVNWGGPLSVLLAGVLLRLLVRFACGHGPDVGAWVESAHIMARDGVVYAETTRYNYGPTWFLILDGLSWMTRWLPQPDSALRFAITLFLTSVDVGLFWLTLRQFGLRVAALFFLNPLSIITTAYLGQFDNFALLVGAAAMLLMPRSREKRFDWRHVAALVVLGLSLMTKHVLFLLPLWLAMRERTMARRILVLCIPVVIFLAGFLPYWQIGKEGIIANVFLYRSSGAGLLWRLIPGLTAVIPGIVLFCGTLAALGWFFREKTPLESFLIYTCSLVLTTSGWYAHYAAIPVLFLAAYWNPFFAAFSAAVTWDFAGRLLHLPGIEHVQHPLVYRLAVLPLLAGYVWIFFLRPRRTGILGYHARDLRIQDRADRGDADQSGTG